MEVLDHYTVVILLSSGICQEERLLGYMAILLISLGTSILISIMTTQIQSPSCTRFPFFLPSFLPSFFLSFGGTRVSTQGLTLAKQASTT
jgi:hypothetical protein